MQKPAEKPLKAMDYQKAQNVAAAFRSLRIMPILAFQFCCCSFDCFIFRQLLLKAKTCAKYKNFARLVYIPKK